MTTSDMFTSQLSSTRELGVVREDVSTRTVTEPLNTDDTSPVPGDRLRKPEPARQREDLQVRTDARHGYSGSTGSAGYAGSARENVYVTKSMG